MEKERDQAAHVYEKEQKRQQAFIVCAGKGVKLCGYPDVMFTSLLTGVGADVIIAEIFDIGVNATCTLGCFFAQCKGGFM